MDFVIRKMLQYMQDEKLIDVEDVEAYQYGMQLMFLKFVHYCGTFILGFLLGRGWEILVFLVCYTLLRTYAGGYHAKHSITCFLVSMTMILFISFTIDILPSMLCFIITMISVLVIVLFSPVMSEELPAEVDEIKRNKRMSRIISILLFASFIVFYITNLDYLYLSISYSLFFCSFYLLIPMGSRWKGRNTNE